MKPELELIKTLEDNNELIDTQNNLYKKLQNIKDPKARTILVFEEMIDRLTELRDKIKNLTDNFK